MKKPSLAYDTKEAPSGGDPNGSMLCIDGLGDSRWAQSLKDELLYAMSGLIAEPINEHLYGQVEATISMVLNGRTSSSLVRGKFTVSCDEHANHRRALFNKVRVKIYGPFDGTTWESRVITLRPRGV
jgi:hypothetical protein